MTTRLADMPTRFTFALVDEVAQRTGLTVNKARKAIVGW
jgi:hypothetical protein